MAVMDKGLKQRIVGALVLVALAVIFLPMLFSREDELRQVVVEAPPMPKAPEIPVTELEQVQVPEPQALPQEPVPSLDDEAGALASVPSSEPAPAAPAQAAPVPPPAAPAQTQPQQVPAQAPAAPVAAVKPEEKRLDANGLPVSWSIQLASLSNRASAENLQKTLRGQGYNAYIRSVEGMNRVFVGPVIERAEANRLRDQLSRQQKLNGFVVRFQPEKG
ncbi:SPOR domain-containing protein [Metapseudomonas furukawaii]|uniref:DedD protein n=1 Tax=Metapseudomonas furukawaii TaxID=1149133 RepID=A0AAD1FGK7_METFU|nr:MULTISPECIES: SPOR domain-containing protein [Pseudomonas]ELS28654.1 DedD protein [Pseudomonas furukawaii]OWJ91848.1 cell division protein [Pseudomonas sp. A46]WAG77245.1 SPOR domain-containing protein [Pseudomonas furukawaii]BAU75239.1 DedD protein [Pseudomonas furukawaii]